MVHKIKIIAILFLLLTSLILRPAFCATQAAEYLCELGIAFYRLGRYDDALHEFNKVLIVDPNNQAAKNYISDIFLKDMPILALKETAPPTEQVAEKFARRPPREEIIKEAAEQKGPAVLSGEYRLSLGMTSEDVIWKDANADRIGVPSEKNWRYLWGDQRHNTYDPKIYDRLTLDMQTQFNSPLNAFMEITIDPWTFVGKNHVTVAATAGGDVVDMDLKYWSADSRTINEIYRSKKGNIINLKQIKVDDGETTVTTPTGITSWATTFNSIQPMEINRDYRPIRKLWFDYKQDDYALKVFPISDEFEAQTTDDPLKISNNHVYWEESPWLDEYEPSRIFENTGEPIKKGRWIRRLSFFTKDSSDDYPHRLTFLRGVSFKTNPGSYSLETTVATPMSLWDEYENSNSIHEATRLKIPLSNDLQLGFTETSKIGVNGGAAEAWNQVGGVDIAYNLNPQTTLFCEVAASDTQIQEAKGFTRTFTGGSAKAGFNFDDTKKKSSKIYASKLWLAYMDSGFYPGLSNYRYTRRDFSSVYFDEQEPADAAIRIGDGIDRGRAVAGFQAQAKLTDDLDSLLNVRRVHKDSGSYVETVSRLETLYQTTDKLAFKFMGWYKHLPKTYAGYDPLIYAKTSYSLTDYFSEEDAFLENSKVLADKDPSIGRYGLGAKYDFSEELSWIGICERTNDPLDFPRGLLNDTSVTTENADGQTWDKVVPFLYDQQFFNLPPYRYYHIAKTKFIFTPTEAWKYILGYTYNQNKHASGINDDINHVGLEVDYIPTDKLTFWFKYIYSRLIDVYKQNKYQSSEYYESHHNVFFGTEYKINPDESFSLLYGEFVGYDDPYEQSKWTLSALDTQHIFRLFYKRKF